MYGKNNREDNNILNRRPCYAWEDRIEELGMKHGTTVAEIHRINEDVSD